MTLTSPDPNLKVERLLKLVLFLTKQYFTLFLNDPQRKEKREVLHVVTVSVTYSYD